MGLREIFGKKLHEKDNGGNWHTYPATPSALQIRIDKIFSSCDGRLVTGMMDDLAKLIEHPDDLKLIKSTPELRVVMLGRGDTKSPMQSLLDNLEADYAATLAKDVPLSHTLKELLGKARLVKAEIEAKLTRNNLQLTVEDGRLVVTENGQNRGSVKLDTPDLTADNTLVSFNGKALNVPQPQAAKTSSAPGADAGGGDDYMGKIKPRRRDGAPPLRLYDNEGQEGGSEGPGGSGPGGGGRGGPR